MTEVSHKTMLEGEKIYPSVLSIPETSIDIHAGDGAIVIGPDNYHVSGNIIPEPWRLRNNGYQNVAVATTNDLIPWSLTEKNLDNIKSIYRPDDISLGPEDEVILMTSDPHTPGDATQLTIELDSTRIKQAPELLIDVVELAAVGGIREYQNLSDLITGGRQQIINSLSGTDQGLTVTAVNPFDYVSPIHPHQYLQRAGRIVAEKYLTLDPSTEYFSTYVKHLLGEHWLPNSTENKLLGLSQFRTASFQINLNVPEDDESLAVPLANHLLFADIDLVLASVLNSSPAVAGILTSWSDIRPLVKLVLASSNPQEEFIPLGDQIHRSNKLIHSGLVPSIARAMCQGSDGNSVFHSNGRIRGDRGPGNSTIEDNLAPTSHDKLQAAYAYIKACQMTYLTYCLKNNIAVDQSQFNIRSINQRNNLQFDLAKNGPIAHQQLIIDHLRFLNDFFSNINLSVEGLTTAAKVIISALSKPSSYSVEKYFDPLSDNFETGLLTDHLRATILQEADKMNALIRPDIYDERMGLAIHRAMMRQSRALEKYYQST